MAQIPYTGPVQKVLYIITSLMMLVVGVYLYGQNNLERASQTAQITNYQECVRFGSKPIDTVPESCSVDGLSFINNEQRLVYQLSTASVTKDWKTYSDAEFGISFNYPKNYFVSKARIEKVTPDEENVFSNKASFVIKYCIKTEKNAQWCAHSIELFDQDVKSTVGQLSEYFNRIGVGIKSEANYDFKGQNMSQLITTQNTIFSVVEYGQYTVALPEIILDQPIEQGYMSVQDLKLVFDSVEFNRE